MPVSFNDSGLLFPTGRSAPICPGSGQEYSQSHSHAAVGLQHAAASQVGYRNLKWGRGWRVGVFWLDSQPLSSVNSLEYHSSMIAEAVKKVIKVGKVSLERLQGLCSVVLLGPEGPLSSRPPQYLLCDLRAILHFPSLGCFILLVFFALVPSAVPFPAPSFAFLGPSDCRPCSIVPGGDCRQG